MALDAWTPITRPPGLVPLIPAKLSHDVFREGRTLAVLWKALSLEGSMRCRLPFALTPSVAPWLIVAMVLVHTMIARECRAAVDPATWITDGQVFSVVPDGSTLYVGGGFNRVGPLAGGGVPVSTSTFAPAAGFPRVAGTVKAVAADGAGGWYVGGSFSYVGGLPRQNLAHITNALAVDGWNPATDGEVRALAVTPGDVVVGGAFATINGQARPRLARVSRSTGQTSGWTPAPDDDVAALASDGTTLYVAGSFTTIAATPRIALAAFTLATDALTSFDPAATSISARITIGALALANGYLYAGGNFNTIGGQSRTAVAALLPGSGQATVWNVSGGTNGAVGCLLPFGDRVFLGGTYTSVGGKARNGVAAADTVSGSVLPWNAGLAAPSGSFVAVSALEAVDARVVVGGSFAGARFDFAAFDTAALATAAVTPEPTGSVFALARQGSQIYVGGAFASYGAIRRTNLVAFDLQSGLPTAWTPDATHASTFGVGGVRGMVVDPDRVYTIIAFNDPSGGAPRCQVRAFARTTAAVAWQVDSDFLVYALALHDGVLYGGGKFSFLGGARTNLAALDAASGTQQGWSPAPSDTVESLLATPGGLVAGGAFATLGGQPRAHLGQLDYTTGLATSWNPGADGPVVSLARSGSTLYAGGSFANAGGQPRARVAALDLGSNSALAWNPGADGAVRALITDGTNVYAGGDFVTFAGQGASHFAGVSAATGTSLGWGASANAPVDALALAVSHVFLGGLFTVVDAEPAMGLAALFDPALLAVDPPVHGNAIGLVLGPSPLRSHGQVRFSLARQSVVTLRAYDVAGRIVRTLVEAERMPAGAHAIAFDRGRLTPGAYMLQLAAGDSRWAARFVVGP